MFFLGIAKAHRINVRVPFVPAHVTDRNVAPLRLLKLFHVKYSDSERVRLRFSRERATRATFWRAEVEEKLKKYATIAIVAIVGLAIYKRFAPAQIRTALGV